MKSSGSVSVLRSHCSTVVLRRRAGQSGPGRQGVGDRLPDGVQQAGAAQSHRPVPDARGQAGTRVSLQEGRETPLGREQPPPGPLSVIA